MNRFIVIEGLDGSGKSTQIDLIKNYLNEKSINYKYLHFPRTDSPIYGDMIARFLRGEFGDTNTINPYLVALLYAGDRCDVKNVIKDWLREDLFVIVDRYVYSNIAFQGAKLDDLNEKRKLKKWIEELEYDYNEIPKPDISLFLRTPFDFVLQNLKNKRSGKDREYLNGRLDIHESNSELQRKVENEYLRLVEEESDIYAINCFDEQGKILPSELIYNRILKFMKEKGIF